MTGGSSSNGGPSRSRIRRAVVPDHHDGEASDPSGASSPAHPRPLLLASLPSLSREDDARGGDSSGFDGDVLAYGGDDGKIYLLEGRIDSTDGEPRPIRAYDDCVRALACSSDGRRVAVGFDDGSVKVYAYDDWTPPGADADDGANADGDANDAAAGARHPFVLRGLTSSSASSSTDDGDDGFLSQSGGLSQADGGGGGGSGEVEFEGPRLDASARHLAFDPRSGRDGVPYYLAIASESGNAPLIVADATDAEAIAGEKFLEDKAADEHDGSGVRCCSYSVVPSSSSSSSKGGGVLLASLGMDGKVATWDVSSSSDPSLMWDACHKDFAPAVPKRDLGELGGDAGDKASGMAWDLVAGGGGGKDGSKAALFLPGQNDVQYRLCPLSKVVDGKEEALSTAECKKHLQGPPKYVANVGEDRHVDAIVAMAVPPQGRPTGTGNEGAKNRLATGGRDGRLLLWDLDLAEGTGTAREVMLPPRDASDGGIPPITSIVWQEDEELRVALADGAVLTVPVDAGGRAKGEEDENDEMVDNEVEDDDDVTVDLATQPAEGAREGTTSEGSTKVKRLSKAAPAAAAEDSDDEALFDEDAPPKTAETPESLEKGDRSDPASEKDEGTTVAAQAKRQPSKFVDDEAEAGGDDGDSDGGDVQFDDVLPTPAKADGAGAGEDGQARADEGGNANGEDREGDDENPFDRHDDPVEFDAALGPTGAFSSLYAAPSVPPQPAFAPSSTPLADPRRILCWNHVGVVTLRPDVDSEDEAAPLREGGNNVVDVSFHETAGLAGGRRPMTFTDNEGLVMGTLGEDGGIFCSDLPEERDDEEEDDDLDDAFDGMGRIGEAARRAARMARKTRRKKRKGAGGGSSVYFRRYETFGRAADKDWICALPDGERAEGCATGAGWGAVVTSRRFLRLFTVSGVQGPVIWIPGEPVTAVGRGRFVAVFHHRGAPAPDGTQSLGYLIVDGVTGATVDAGDVSALGPGSSLAWVGFSDKCVLSAMDSDGTLSMLARGGGGSRSGWMPLLDTTGLRKVASDAFWPVEVYGGKLVCVPLRGGKEYPDASRRPVTTTLNLRMPLATSMTPGCGLFEETSVRAIFALNQEKVLDDYLVSMGDADEEQLDEEYRQKCIQVDKATLKLFMRVVQAGKVERAYDLVHRLHSEKSFNTAIQIADRVGHRKLSDRIEEAMLQKFPPIEEEDEGGEFDDNASYASGARSEASGGSYDEEPVVTTRQQRMELLSQQISPEGGREGVSTPRQQGRPRKDAGAEREAYSTDEESPPRESLKRKFERDVDDGPPASSRRRINPFAKKRLESPAKRVAKATGTPTKLSLSRNSTFSAKSRQKQRSGKQIV